MQACARSHENVTGTIPVLWLRRDIGVESSKLNSGQEREMELEQNSSMSQAFC